MFSKCKLYKQLHKHYQNVKTPGNTDTTFVLGRAACDHLESITLYDDRSYEYVAMNVIS